MVIKPTDRDRYKREPSMMVGIRDLTEKERAMQSIGKLPLMKKPKPIPVVFPKRHLPIEKIFGFDLPRDRGGYLPEGARWQECPNCGKGTAVIEIYWVGGLGKIPILVCDYCGYWEREV